MPVNELAAGLVSMIDSTRVLSRILSINVGRSRGTVDRADAAESRSDRRSERNCPDRSDRPDYSTSETRNGSVWLTGFPGGKRSALDLLTQLFCWFDGLSVM